MLAVVGSRSFTVYSVLEESLEQWEQDNDVKIDTIVSGGARGTDTLAVQYARSNGLMLIEYLPDYEKYSGSKAPLERNTLIVDKADYLIAFPTEDSRGTWNSVQKARKKGIPVTIIHV